MVTIPPSSQHHGQRITANPQIVSAIMLSALVVLVASLLTSRGTLNANPSRTPAVPTTANLSQMPLAFVPNAGQTDAQVRFATQAMGGTLYFTMNEVILSLPTAENTAIVRMQFQGAATQPDLRPGTQIPGVANFIDGSQPAQWHTNLPTYSGITYGQLYDGINLHYDGTDGRLKSTYIIAANADPSQIRWRYAGITNATIDSASGDLHMAVPYAHAPLIERAPIAWQEQNGLRIPVTVSYNLGQDGSIGFALGAYNSALPLTIDPTLEYSTFIGGSGADRINAIAIDPGTGDIFITGETSSSPFPGSPTSIGTTGAGSFPNVFVVRVKADGSGTAYRTVIGGTNTDKGLAIVISTGGIANVAGYSFSNNFPTTAGTAVSATYNNNGDTIAFALNADGTLGYSSYLGGTSLDMGYAIAASGNLLYIAGSTDGVVTGASSGPAGGTDAIVYKIDTTISGASGQLYARRLGGLFNDTARAIALDNSDNVYITGSTLSDNTTFAAITPYQNDNAGGSDLFITKLNTAGTPVYNSFLGGSDTDEGFGITVDPAGNQVYLTGRTLSSAFPGTVGSPVGQDAFVTKINIATNTIAYSRYLGSPGVDVGNAIAIDTTGAAYVAGSTSSTSFYSQNPLPEMVANGGNVDGFITRFDPAGNPSYSSRIGGNFDDVATSVATFQAAQGTKVYVSGYTNSGNFPMTTPPTTIQPTIGGSDDGFLVRIANARPQVDLNDGTIGNGIDFGPVTWTEAGGAVTGSGPVAIDNPTGLTVLDSDSATLAYAEVRFVASAGTATTAITPPNGASESLSVTLSGGITGSYNNATGILRLTGGGGSTLNDFRDVLRSIAYNNTSQNPTAGSRLIAVEVNDGIDSNIPFAFSTINVVPTNDPPVVTVPGSGVTLNEEATATISGVSVADVDAGSGTINITVSVPVAAGTLTATANGAATVTPASGASVVIAGSLTDVNATLATLGFTGATDFNTSNGTTNTPITLTVLADDQGNTPTPAQTDQKTLNITVNPVNDAPVVPVVPASVTVLEDTAKTISIVSDLGLTDAKDLTSPPATAGGTSFPPVQSITITTPPTNGTISGINLTNGT
ncbi:MAG: SBBP repeat-containing protein, partial [Roseiflexaceae bacterium]|nr:SBBP repeat-containing protein [Roseiflexaceae bacterium]